MNYKLLTPIQLLIINFAVEWERAEKNHVLNAAQRRDVRERKRKDGEPWNREIRDRSAKGRGRESGNKPKPRRRSEERDNSRGRTPPRKKKTQKSESNSDGDSPRESNKPFAQECTRAQQQVTQQGHALEDLATTTSSKRANKSPVNKGQQIKVATKRPCKVLINLDTSNQSKEIKPVILTPPVL